MSEKKDVDCLYTDEIVCPYCGYEFSDSWEFSMKGDGDTCEVDCDECEKTFTAVMSMTVDYSTYKKKEKPMTSKDEKGEE